MSDEHFYTPGRKIPIRKLVPGESLWALRKGGKRLHAELRDHGVYGVELQLFDESGWLFYGRRYESRGIAVEEALACRRQYEADGWIDGGAS